MKQSRVLFIQRRSTRAGAQTSLYRLLQICPDEPMTLIAEEGWLSSALDEVLIHPWPSPRSLGARMGGLKMTAKKIAKKVPSSVKTIVANDHQECALAVQLGAILKAKVIGILRTPGMTERDFNKYACGGCDHIFTVGEELSAKVKGWTQKPISIFQEGFLESEFQKPALSPENFPEEILIAGSSEPRKGFSDLLEAIRILKERDQSFPVKKIVLTGDAPEQIPDLDCELEYVGRVTEFTNFARRFAFAVHPSRHETFGLAPLELIIAGIPTLCTRTGCADESLLSANWLCAPADPTDLADTLTGWINNWSSHQSELERSSEKIRDRFSIEATSREFLAAL